MEKNTSNYRLREVIKRCDEGFGNSSATSFLQPLPVENIYQQQMSLLAGQNYLSSQVQGVNEKIDEALRRRRKDYRHITAAEVSYVENRGLFFIQIYDNAEYSCSSLFTEEMGKIDVTKLSVREGQFEFLLVVIAEKKSIVFLKSEIKPAFVYEKFVQAGFILNPRISKKSAMQALCDFLNAEFGAARKSISLSGDAGWEDGQFKCAQDLQFMTDYKFKLKLPIFDKNFDKDAVNLAGIADYSQKLCRIREEKYRLLFALTPFAGMLYTPLAEKNCPAPFVLNLILMTENMCPEELCGFFQIFNRNSSVKPYGIQVSDKNLQEILECSKDEVVSFMGFQSDLQSDYKNQKIIRNMDYLVNKALGTSGGVYGEKPIRSVIAFMSNQQLLHSDVINIFVDDDFLQESSGDGHLDCFQSIFSAFVWYMETHWPDFESIMELKSSKYANTKEYWSVLLQIVDDFWKCAGHSLKAILNLPENFDCSVLWETNDVNYENCTEVVRKAVRISMRNCIAADRRESNGTEKVIFDEDSVWITPDLFTDILRNQGLLNAKDKLLLGCKQEGSLKMNETTRGFTSRLQIDGVRREFYRFKREAMNEIGKAELADLAKGGVSRG